MARIIPSDLPDPDLVDVHEGELRTLIDLRVRLHDDYTVFHGVHWVREKPDKAYFGEIDFVIVNRHGKVLLIIYCPDYHVKNINAAAPDTDRVVDAGSDDGICGRIDRVLGLGEPRYDDWLEMVLDFFSQTFEVVPDIHAFKSAQQRQFTRQSGTLAKLLDNLEMHTFRLRIEGTAGSGKSLLARRFYDRAIAASRRPLMVCFNRPLAERLKRNTNPGGYTNTFQGLCYRFLEARGQSLDFSSMRSDPGFWNKVLERVTEEDIPQDWRFDTLVVDEGQDFDQEWFEILQPFLADPADILWVGDSDQNLRGRVPVTLDGFATYHARENSRTPESVARFIREHLAIGFEPANRLPGLGVTEHRYRYPQEQPRIVNKVVNTLRRAGFTNDDIVVLSFGGIASSIFKEHADVGRLPLRRFTGEYDRDGNQILSDGGIVFESIYRFKGQQAPAVIVVDVDTEGKETTRWQHRLYCCLTRASVRVDLLTNGELPSPSKEPSPTMSPSGS